MVIVKNSYPFEPDYAVAPGETLLETIESLGMSQVELAIRTGMSGVSINRIIKGEQPITAEMAGKLEMVTGFPSRLWNNLESQYREQLEKIAVKERFKQNLDWLRNIPVKELIKRGALPDIDDQAEILHRTLSFYGVSSVETYDKLIQQHGVAARRSEKIQCDPASLAAWLRFGEIEASKITCKPYDAKLFLQAIHGVCSLTIEDPKIFVPKMVSQCANAGVAVAIVPEMPKAPWYGASRWLTPEKAMILLNLRGKREDYFWFSFFHEAGHILRDSKKELFTNDGTSDDPCEQRANCFAHEILIPKSYIQQIDALKSRKSVIELAQKLGIAPGIVAGEFQRRTQKWDWFVGLIRKFQ